MRRLLQSFDFRKSGYERPNQNWLCGQSGRGKACRIGPDRRGRCRASFECTPRKDGDRWHCTRAPSVGGSCTNGPLPDGACCLVISKCVPVRSLRAKRRLAVLWASALTIGLLAIVLEGSVTATVFSPGPVTLQHSQAEGCAACHQDFDKGPLAWVHVALGSDDGLADSKQCLGCHGWEEHAFAPHSMDPKTLAKSPAGGGATVGNGTTPVDLKLARALFSPPNAASSPLACGTCHKEHRGGDVDLTVMGNGQCQSCHSVRFASLAEGHPDFGSYPYLRRTRINFDHWSHIERHFEKAGAEKSPNTCTDCHFPTGDGELMLVQSFEETCAVCHLSQIGGEGLSGAKGTFFLTVPGFDLAVLRESGIEIGEWPELSEERITPFLRTLLADSEGSEADLRRIDSLDPLDLTDASPEDLAAVGNVVWALKSLIHDFLAIGMAPVEDKITATMGQEVEQGQLGQLLGAVPLDVIRAAQEAWFPNLFQEIALHRAGSPVPAPLSPGESEEAVPAGEAPEGTGQDEAADDEILSDDEDILSDDEEILSDDEDILSDDEEILADDEDILADDEDILAEDDEILSDDDGDQDSAESEGGVVDEALSELDAEAWAGLGGWYRIDFGLYFKPTGHADPFMRTWLDLSGRAFDSSKDSVAGQLFETLAHKNAPGRCVKCHSVDRTADNGSLVNWYPKQQEPDFRHPTLFSHTSHFSLLDEEGCNTCHKIDRSASYAAAFEHSDPGNFASNFRPLDRAICAQCHVEDQAGDSCLSCHRYHVGRFPGAVVETIMRGENGSAAETGNADQ